MQYADLSLTVKKVLQQFKAVAFIMMCFVLFAGCGVKGPDGKVFLKVTAPSSGTIYYWDDNPDMPYDFDFGTYYETHPGSYSYRYHYSGDTEWSGTYKLTANEGKDGTLFADGEAGADFFCSFNCYRSGPTVSSVPPLNTFPLGDGVNSVTASRNDVPRIQGSDTLGREDDLQGDFKIIGTGKAE